MASAEGKLAKAAVIIALLVGCAVMSVDLMAIARDPVAWVDMKILFPIVKAWDEGSGSLYGDFLAQEGVPGAAYYRFPPLWGFAVKPLARNLELHAGIAVWAVIATAVLLGGLFHLMRMLGIRPLSLPSAVFLLFLAFFGPLYESFYGPTKDLVMVGLLAVAFALGERRRWLLGGLAFAGAIVLKIYPCLFGFYFLLRRDFRLLGATAGWFVVLNLLPVPFIGTRETLDFYLTILPMTGGSSAFPENAGFEMLLMAWNWMDWFRHGTAPLDPLAFPVWLGHLWRILVISGFIPLAAVLHRRGALDTACNRMLLFGAWCSAVLVILPVSWVNYQLFLAIPVLGMIHRLRYGALRPLLLVSVLMCCCSLLVMTTPFKRLALSSLIDPDMSRAAYLSTTVGIELHAEFEERVRARKLQQDLPGNPADNPPAGTVSVQRRTSLGDSAVISWMVLRSLAGVLFFLGSTLACVSVLFNGLARPAKGAEISSGGIRHGG